jgi:hypothetical protein
VEPGVTETSPTEDPSRPTAARPTLRSGLARGLAAIAVLVVVAAPILYFALDEDARPRSDRDVVETDPVAAVRAAVGLTMAAGSYEMDTVSTSTSAPRTSCGVILGPGATAPERPICPSSPPVVNRFDTHSVVNFEPYAMRSETQASSLGAITTHINSTHVWQKGGATVGYGPGSPGIPIPDYANQVLGTIGRGPGALAMLSLASRGGYLNLEEQSVTTAQPAGTGTVRGDPVTYYDVTIDVKQLAQAPGLSDVQRTAIGAAIVMLEQAGYSGTHERIGIDERGFIREVDATTTFADGSSMERHSVLYNFGCAPKVTMPNEPPAPATATPCDAPPVTTVGASPSSTTTSTTGPPVPTSTTPPTTSASTSTSTSAPPSTSTTSTTTTSP